MRLCLDRRGQHPFGRGAVGQAAAGGRDRQRGVGEVAPAFLVVVASYPVGAKRRRMTGLGETIPLSARKNEIASAFAQGASPESQPGIACAASVDGSSL